MALKLWLPLNGNANNYGLTDLTMSGSPASWQNGPTGKCASFNNNAGNVISNSTTDLNFTTQNFSWSVWINKNWSSHTNNAMYAFTVGRADAGGWGYGLEVASTTEVRLRFGSWSNTISGVPDNEWHHIAFVRNGDTLKIYRDGACVATASRSGSLPTYSDGGGPGIGCFHYTGNIYPLIGHLSDFRIYDHALSDMDVKEISEALVLHYPLDSIDAFGTNNMLSTTHALGALSGNFERISLAEMGINEPGFRFTLYYTGTGSNYYPKIYSGNLSKSNFTVGKTYVWSIKYRVNRWSTGNISFRHACWTNDSTTGGAGVIADSTKVDGKWHEVATAWTITQENYDNSSFGPRIELCCSNLNSSGTVYDFSIDLREAQIIEADKYVGWVDRRSFDYLYCDNKLVSNAGICKENTALTRNGVMKPVASAMYQCACDFNQAGFLYNETMSFAMEKFTIAFWFNARANSSQHFLVGMFSAWDQNGIGIYRDGNRNYFIGRMKAGSVSSVDIGGGAATFSYNTWNHWALVWNGSNIMIYLNGVLKNTTSYAASGAACALQMLHLGNSKFCSSGHSYPDTTETEECAMSDFRLYGSALPAERIMALYQTRASIDRNKCMHTFSFKENPVGLRLGRNGIFEAPQWYEGGYRAITSNGSSSYTPTADTTNSCSSNIVIQLNRFDTSVTDFKGHKYRMVFDLSWSNYSRGNVWYQGAINDSWSSGYTHVFRNAANEIANIQTLVNASSAPSGSRHVDTIVTMTESGAYKFFFQFRTDNSDGVASFSITNFYVYELGGGMSQNLASFTELKEI